MPDWAHPIYIIVLLIAIIWAITKGHWRKGK